MADKEGSTADVSVSTEGTGASGEVTQQVEVMDAPQENTTTVEPWADLVDDIPAFSMDELTGVDDADTGDESTETGEEATDDKQDTAATSESEAETSGETDADGESQEDETQQASTEEPDDQEPDKEPEGYVKLEALHQARGENRYLKTKISQLEAEKAAIKQQAEKPDWMSTFKRLNSEELRDLMADDAEAAVQYAERLAEFNTFEKDQEAKVKAAEEQAEQTEIMVNTAFERIESAAPGIYTDAAVANKLADFAESIGFSENMFALTNPRNTISVDGGQPVPLGEMAAGLVELLSNLNASIDSQFGDGEASQPAGPASKKGNGAAGDQSPEVQSLTDKIAELEKSIGEMKGQVIDKLKGGESKDGVTTLSDVQNSGDEDFSTASNLTIEQIEKLTPEQQQRYLSGIDQ